MMTESDAARVQVDTFPAHLAARQNVSSSNASSIPRLLGVVRPGVKPECICVDTFPGERLRFRSTTLDEVLFFRQFLSYRSRIFCVRLILLSFLSILLMGGTIYGT